MCTVTWWREPDVATFGVWFNRDESRTRPASDPVGAQVAADGTPFLAPRDSAAGGTWLLANAHGLVVGVLNFYAVAARAAGVPRLSRGTLPLSQCASRSVDEVGRSLGALDREAYAPFILVAWDRERFAAWSWDGRELVRDDAPAAPLTTSSFRSPDVCAWRRSRYAALVARPTASNLAAYHNDVAHADPAFNVRMRRPDARTESACRVTVSPTDVRYWHRREAAAAVAARDERELVIART